MNMKLTSLAVAIITSMPILANAQVRPAPCDQIDSAPVVHVSVGKSTVLKPSSAIDRILLGNPEGSRATKPVEGGKATDENDGDKGGDKQRPGVANVDVVLLSKSELFIVGKTIGSSNVVLRHENGRCSTFDVVVNMDVTALSTVISRLLPEEKNVRVDAAFDSIVLQGSVKDNGSIVRILDLTNAYVRGAGAGIGGSVAGANPRIINMLSTGAPQQVMLEVKVAEVSKTLMDRLGASVGGDKTNGSWTYSLLANFLSGGAGVASVVKNGTDFITIDAQKDDGLVKVLAEPTIMAISGQRGSFNAGGKIFIPVAQNSSSGSGTTITLEEKPFGVSVAFMPTVLDGGRINLEVATEVSDLNREGIGVTAPGSSSRAVLPSFSSRSAKTTVQLMDGQSFAIGGLIKNNSTTDIKAFPFLGEIPILGALFRSTNFQTDKSELVFVITPRLAKPLPENYKLPTDNYVPPSRADVQLGGRLEGSTQLYPTKPVAQPVTQPQAPEVGMPATPDYPPAVPSPVHE